MWGTPTGMADIFISYARHDREQVETLARALEKAGFSVWWDRDIAVGETFAKTIEKELNVAKAVVVAWSEYGNASEWVKDEATFARDQQKLFPIRLDSTSAPLGFQQFQSADFSGWKGDASAPEVQSLIAALHKNSGLQPSTHAIKPETPSLNKESSSLSNKKLVIASCLGAVALAIGAFLFLTRSGSSPAEPTAENQTSTPVASTEISEAAENHASLAVLPFVNMSSDPEQEYFADGLSEELLNWLANVQGLKVPGRTSSFQYKGKLDDLRQIGKELDVRYLLEGSVRRSGSQLRITAQLIEAENGYHLWSETYDRDIADIFAIQDEISRIVVTELLGVLPESGVINPAAVGDVDPLAHEHYLAGRALWSQRRGSDALAEFEKAIALDPDHALAQAYYAIAAAFAVGNNFSYATDPDFVKRMNAALEKAVEIDPTSADVVFAQGWVQDLAYSSDTLGAAPPERIVDFYKRAVRLNPRHVEALHALARSENDHDKRTELLEQVISIDEGIVSARINLANNYLRFGEDQKAFSILDRTYIILPATPKATGAIFAKNIGDLAHMGEYLFSNRETESAFEKYDFIMSAQTLADLGAAEEARYLLNQANDENIENEIIRIFDIMLSENYDLLLERAHILEQSADFTRAQVFWPMAMALLKAGQAEQALGLALEQNPQILSAYTMTPTLTDSRAIPAESAFIAGLALEALGRNDEANELWRQMIEQNTPTAQPLNRWEHPLSMAILNAKLGAKDEAIAAFQDAYNKGFRFLYSFNCEFSCINFDLVASDGYFASLQGAPQFDRIMEAIKEDNARALESFERRYGILTEIREQMAAAAPRE